MATRINPENINLGNGILEIGTYHPTTGAFQTYTDVGSVKGTATLTYTRETARFETGRPQVLVKEEVIREGVEFRITLAELTVANLKLVLGTGTTSTDSNPSFLSGNGLVPSGDLEAGSSSAGVSTKFVFGGDCSSPEVALRFTHQRDCELGKRNIVEVFKATFSGNLALPFNEGDWNLYEVSFMAHADTARVAGAQLLQFVIEN